MFRASLTSLQFGYRFPNGSSFNLISLNHSFNINQWYHVAVKRTGTTVELFVDGVSLGTGTFSGNVNFPSTVNTYIGRWWNGSGSNSDGYYFAGKMDRLSVWSVALSSTDINAYASCPPVGNENGLIGYWNFNEGTGTSTADLSSNGHTGNIIGAAWSTDVKNSTCTITNNTPFMPFNGTNNYVVSGMDAIGCTNTDTVSVTVNTLPVLLLQNDTSICAGDTITLAVSGASTYLWNTGATTTSITVSPSTTTTYSVTGTDANGCIKTDSVVITVNSLPVISINSGVDAEICLGQSTNLTAAGGSTYVWSTSATSTSISVSPTDTTNYSVIGTDANGCIGYDTISVIVNPLPVVFAGNDTAYCAGDSVTLSGSGASTYTWNNGVANEFLCANYSRCINNDN